MRSLLYLSLQKSFTYVQLLLWQWWFLLTFFFRFEHAISHKVEEEGMHSLARCDMRRQHKHCVLTRSENMFPVSTPSFPPHLSPLYLIDSGIQGTRNMHNIRANKFVQEYLLLCFGVSKYMGKNVCLIIGQSQDTVFWQKRLKVWQPI